MAGANNKVIIGGIAAAFIACCMAFTAPSEGEKFKSYPDTGNIWTICRGHTDGVKEGDVATKEQCDAFYHQDIVKAIAMVDMLTDGADIPPETKKVFVDQVFNAGAGLFAKSTMLRKIKAGDLVGACHEFKRWVYVAGKDCRVHANNCYGIVTRRANQEAQCLKGLTP